MAILKQHNSKYATFIGWYGKCGEPKCQKFDLATQKTKINMVWAVDASGTSSKMFLGRLNPSLNKLRYLECGHAYYIRLERGDGEVNIPELVSGHMSSDNLGSIVKNCTPPRTPSPTNTNTNTTSETRGCPKDTRECPDGVAVRDSRILCKFVPCGFSLDQFFENSKKFMDKQYPYYSFDMQWFNHKSSDADLKRFVRIWVQYGRIVRIRGIQTTIETVIDEYGNVIDMNNVDLLDELDLIENETKTDFDIDDEYETANSNAKVLSIEHMFSLIRSWLYKSPYSLEVIYDEAGFINHAKLSGTKQDHEDEKYIGYKIVNFTELSLNGKCRSDYKKCKDGTIIKRNPQDNCRFTESCNPNKNTPTPTQTEYDSGIPQLQFRVLKQPLGKNRSFNWLQIRNLPNPQPTNETDRYLSWRTVYGSRKVNPVDVKSNHWKHIQVSSEYIKQYGETMDYKINDSQETIKIKIDTDNKNQLVVQLNEASEFVPNPPEIDKTSHLYMFVNDKTETSSYSAWTYPRINVNSMPDSVNGLACSEDVMECLDGSFVSRNPSNNCEFEECIDMNDFEDSVFDELQISTLDQLDTMDATGFMSEVDGQFLPDEVNTDETAFVESMDVYEEVNDENGLDYENDSTNDVDDTADDIIEEEYTEDPNEDESFDPVDTVCPADVFECDDGSFVSRDPNNACEFFECPNQNDDSVLLPGNFAGESYAETFEEGETGGTYTTLMPDDLEIESTQLSVVEDLQTELDFNLSVDDQIDVDTE